MSFMKRTLFILILKILIIQSFLFAQKKLFVVTTTQDLADLAKNVGKDKIEVVSLTYGWQDPHRIELRPSMVSTLAKADLVIKIGMDLDSWVDSLIFASRNSKIAYGQKGYLDVSSRIKKLEVPEGKVDASMGDIHIYGNPHYWLSPTNAKIIVEDIAERLAELSEENKTFFEENAKQYVKELDKKINEWTQKVANIENKKVVSYHKTFAYFYNEFGFKEIATVEPKPGIPPTPKYLNSLIEKINQEKPLCILHESFYPLKNTKFLSQKTNIPYVVVSTSVGGEKGIEDYITLIDTIINKICSVAQTK
mgnify:CR=1 FL=1